jgi:alkylated DNA nucleotide flippase Atl1
MENRMKKVTKKKTVRLSDKLVKVLVNLKTTVTYGKLANKFGTNARAVGQAVKKISKTNPELTKNVVYAANTRPKKYTTKTK